LRPTRLTIIVTILLCFQTAVRSQGDFLKIYFPKEEDSIIKLFTLAADGDSAAFFNFANRYKATAVSQKNFPLLCNINEKISVYYFYKGNISKAYSFYDSSIAIIKREKLPEYNYYSVYKNRGVMRYSSQDFYGALNDYKKCEALMVKYQIGDIGALYNNISQLYLIASDVVNGKKYIFKAMPFIKLSKEKNSYIKLMKSLGSVYVSENRYKSGDSLLKVAAALSKENNLMTNYAECLYEYTNSLKRQERLPEAQVVFAELVELTKQLKDDDWRLQVTLELAKINFILGHKNEAKKNLLAAEKIVPSNVMPNLEKLDVYKNLGIVYKDLGYYEKAADAYQKFISLKETEELNDDIGRLGQLSVEYERKQDSISVEREKELILLSNLREQEKAESKLKQQRIIIIVSLVGFILIIGFSISLIRANRNKEKANKEITYQKGLLTEKNKEITDSITYAQRIQQSLLPPLDLLEILLPDHFLLYTPKDIVSGDFFWAKKLNAHEVFIAVADCTGHGVPGAMMSALSIQNLNELSTQTRSASELLSLLNINLKKTLNQGQEGFSKDGLDICLCKINSKERKITYSGANRSLQVYNENGLKQEIKATKTGIAGHTSDDQIYAEHEFILEQDEMVVMSTDGFADQFGGPDNKKITTKRFKEWITDVIRVDDKRSALEQRFKAWKASKDQIDDVCVLGFKI